MSAEVAAEPRFVARTKSDSVAVPKYWAGKVVGTWPEYSRDREKAAACSERTAKAAAAQFNARMASLTWTTEPALVG